jgi:hypothetical protein
MYTGVKAVIADFLPDSPEILVSVGVFIAGCVHLPQI